MPEFVCVNERLVEPTDARVSVFDSGFMQGIGLFETMRVYRGRVFRLDHHLERLARSATKLGWTICPSRELMRRNIDAVLSIGAAAQRLRLTVTTGTLRDRAGGDPELTIVASASTDGVYPRELYERGVTLAMSPYRQSAFDPTVGHKTTSYFSRLAALREAHARQAFESLWLTPDERIAEGSISNVFLVRDQTLLTPTLDTPVLPGITRGAVIDAAVASDIPVRECDLTIDDLMSADEVFLTNSMVELIPVVRVERHAIGSEKPGDVTRDISEAFGELLERELAEDAGE
ncbi:MAG: aminotransferase class IV family protein [Phycisphaerales bacterium]|nr:aminotransferase class IV family protein [Phycisphaerales bacterium]